MKQKEREEREAKEKQLYNEAIYLIYNNKTMHLVFAIHLRIFLLFHKNQANKFY